MPPPNLGLPVLGQGQAQTEIAYNEALLRLDALVFEMARNFHPTG